MNKTTMNKNQTKRYSVLPIPLRSTKAKAANSQLLKIKPYLSESKKQNSGIAGRLISQFPEVENCLPKLNDQIDDLDLRIIYKTNELIQNLRLIAKNNNFWWYEPLGNISIDDEIVLEWWHQKKKLTIYVCSNSIDFIKVWGPDMDNEMEDGSIYIKDEMLESLWEWIAT